MQPSYLTQKKKKPLTGYMQNLFKKKKYLKKPWDSWKKKIEADQST